MTDQLEGQMNLFDLDIWSGKTYPEPSPVTVEKTSKPSSRKSSGSPTQTLPMCLCLIEGGGAKVDAYTPMWVNGQLLGEYTMLSFGESPREENASLLSQILQDSAPQKYYLSARACEGILNRAARRQRELPEILKTALENQINRV